MKKILSIDGGGIRGLIPALLLAEIEEQTQKPTVELFDIIAGTSTGGILTLGLAYPDTEGKPRYSAEEMTEIYSHRGKDIFPHSLWRKIRTLNGIFGVLYSPKGLETVLDEYFGNTPLTDALTRVLIPAYDIQNRTPFFMKSWKNAFRYIPMKNVARATVAAPTLFPPALIPVGDSIRALVDGGIYVNSPAISALCEARKLFPDENDFLLVSLGTGSMTRPINYTAAKRWGKLGWIMPLLLCMFDGSSTAVDYQSDELLNDDYYRFQPYLDHKSETMDNYSSANIIRLEGIASSLISSHHKEIAMLSQRLVENK